MKPVYNYVSNLDAQTLSQFNACVQEEYVVSAALMPDAHLGYSAPIGAVLVTKGKVVPAWVGFDIGCGVSAIKIPSVHFDKIVKNSKKIYDAVSKAIPMGVGEKNNKNKLTIESEKKLSELIKKYEKSPKNKSLYNFFKQSTKNTLGTLGGGNHFIELGKSEKGKEVWLIIHSGSRSIGHRIATFYMQEAAKLANNSEAESTNPLDADSELGKEYLAAHDVCSEFALLNRLEMGQRAIDAISSVLHKKIKLSLWVNKNHNYVVFEKGLYVHRKGATPANKGERGVIPGNMRDGSVLVVGKGNKKFINSSSHGAGRAMSRRDASQKISMEQFKYEMSGIVANVSQETLNEAPMAYKNLDSVMAAQKESVKIVKKILPLINWKGVEKRSKD